MPSKPVPRWLVVCVGAIMVLGGCAAGTRLPPTTAYRSAPAAPPEPPYIRPDERHSFAWRDIDDACVQRLRSARGVRVTVEFHGEEGSGASPARLKMGAKRVLQAAGITYVADDEDAPSDATLRIELYARAALASYARFMDNRMVPGTATTRYTGASVNGFIRFEAPGFPPVTEAFGRSIPTAPSIMVGETSPFGSRTMGKPSDAPIGDAFRLAYAGDEEDEPFARDRWGCSYLTKLIGLIGAIHGPDAVARMLTSREYAIRDRARFLLETIQDPLSIPPLIDLLDYRRTYAREAAAAILTNLTGADFGQDKALWNEWWEQNNARLLAERH